MDELLKDLANAMVKNAASDYKRRSDAAALERRRACIKGELTGKTYKEISKELVEIEEKYDIL